MKKDRIYTLLDYSNGMEQVLLNKGRDSISSEELLNMLRGGVETKNLRDARKIQNVKMTKYFFDMKSYDENKGKDTKRTFVVAVRNSQKQYLGRTVESLDDICIMNAQMRKKNMTRFIAGISAGMALIIVAGPTIAKGLADCIKKSYEYDTRISREAYEDYIRHQGPTDEEIRQAKEEYYRDLEQRAKSGDEDAIREYSQYLIEQELKEQLESGTKTR